MLRTHTTSNLNKDLSYGELLNIKSPYGFHFQDLGNNITVITDLAPYGTKSRMSDKLAEDAANAGYKYLTYRGTCGLALPAITASANKFGLKTRIFTFAKKGLLTKDLNLALDMGAEISIRRYAAASHLNKIQREWCLENKGVLIPLGLPSLETTSAIVSATKDLLQDFDVICSVAGSGTLTRALQIAAPNKQHFITPVSRNLKDGEKGIARIIDYQQKFEDEPIVPAPFDSIQHYDGKSFRLALDIARVQPNAKIAIFNVGRAPKYLSESTTNTFLPKWHTEKIISKEFSEQCLIH